MSVFIVVIDDNEHKTVKERLIRRYAGKNYQFRNRENLFLIASDDASDLICAKIGITGDDKVDGASGAVFQLNLPIYAGFADKNLWEWLTGATV